MNKNGIKSARSAPKTAVNRNTRAPLTPKEGDHHPNGGTRAGRSRTRGPGLVDVVIRAAHSQHVVVVKRPGAGDTVAGELLLRLDHAPERRNAVAVVAVLDEDALKT